MSRQPKIKKASLKCHECGAKSMTRIEEVRYFEKEFDGTVLIFEAYAECDCGYVHGGLVDLKEVKNCE